MPSIAKSGAVCAILAAGSSTRAGTDKITADLGGQPVLAWSLASAIASGAFERIVIVVRPDVPRGPIEAIVHPDELDVLGVMKPGKEYFALEVRGNSMIEDHIRDGDYVIVERTPSARSGETVVALLEGGEATLKRFYRDNGRIRLQPANGTMDPILVDKVDIQGVVVCVFRKL